MDEPAPPPAPPESPASPAPMAPVPESRRIDALDVARGVALLGIFCVNIQSFGEPFGKFLVTVSPTGASTADAAAFYFVKIFCEGKFYPVFSTLFGIGLGIQWMRARRAGARFNRLSLRRVGVLGAIGLMHGVLLWYGDILFLYAVVGAIMLLFAGLPARTLAIAGTAVVGASILLGTCAGVAGMFDGERHGAVDAAPADAAGDVLDVGSPDDGAGESPFETISPEGGAVEPEERDGEASESKGAAESGGSWESTPFARLVRGFTSGTVKEPWDPVWIEAETEAFRDGPFLQAALVRALLYFSMLVFSLFGFGVQIAGLFMIGMALVKAGAFAPERLHWHRRLLALGAFVGFPIVLVVAILPRMIDPDAAVAIVTPLQMLGGSLMALGYLGGVTLWVASGRARRLAAALAPVGRMALTNYLTQTVIATFIMYHWGLGLFGETTRAQRMGIVAGVYCAQVAFSGVWLGAFRFGPLEWVWRTLTYGRRQPMLRRADAATTS